MAKLAALKGYYDIEIMEYPIPEPMDDSLVIKVEAAAICGFDRQTTADKNPHLPGNMGHEFCGRIVSMGKDARKSIYSYGGELNIGDRIVVYPHVTCGVCPGCLRFGNGVCGACTAEFFYGAGWDWEGDQGVTETRNARVDLWPHFKGGFGEYVHVFGGTYVWKVPDDMPSEIAALLDPCAVAMRAVEQAMTVMGSIDEGLSTSSTAVIVGAGPIGVMTAMILKHMGVGTVILDGKNEAKLQRAKEISNADITVEVSGMTSDERVEKILEITNGGADLVINCASHPSSQEEALRMVGFMGYYVEVGNAGFAGDPPYMSTVNLTNLLFAKNAHICSLCANSPKTFDRAFNLLKKHDILPFHKLITHPFYSLEDLLPTIQKMRDSDYIKGVYIAEKKEK